MNRLIQNEELKRERHWSGQERWRLIQEALNWAETQSTVRRNNPKSRLEEQARKNAFFHERIRRAGVEARRAPA